MDGKLAALARSSVTSGYTKPELRSVARLGDLVDLSPRQVLMAAGARRTGCVLLLSGTVVTTTADAMWLTSGAGALIGLAETLTSSPVRGDTVVISAGQALVFHPGAFHDALGRVEPLRRAALAQLAMSALEPRRSPVPVAWALD